MAIVPDLSNNIGAIDSTTPKHMLLDFVAPRFTLLSQGKLYNRRTVKNIPGFQITSPAGPVDRGDGTFHTFQLNEGIYLPGKGLFAFGSANKFFAFLTSLIGDFAVSIEFVAPVVTTGQFPKLSRADDGTNQNFIVVYYDQSQNLYIENRVDGVSQFFGSNTTTANKIEKFGYARIGNNILTSLNGVSGPSSSVAGNPSFNQIVLGSGTPYNHINSYVRKARIAPSGMIKTQARLNSFVSM